MESVCSLQQNMLRMAMRMAAVSTITLLLLSCSVITSTGSSDKCIYVTTGSPFLVNLTYPRPSSETLNWFHIETVIFRRKGSNVVTGKPEDVDENGSLKLNNIQKTMAGIYKSQVYDIDGTLLDESMSNLCVFDPVPKPSVTSKCNNKTHVTFSCNVAQAKDISFAWLMNGNVLKTEKKKDLTRESKRVEKDSFSCHFFNPADSKTSAPVTQNCFSSSFLPERLFGVSIWIFVGCGAGIVLLLIIIVIVCCIHAGRKKKTIKMDEEELRLGWASSEQQQQQQQQRHHHHHHPQHQHHQHNHPPDYHHPHQQQPAGHTGPRQHRSKPHREPRPRAPEPSNGHPQPSPRRKAEGPRPVDNDDEQPPPLPQPRKKTSKV